jgi:hypothetical protein
MNSKLNYPILIAGFSGPGVVGSISANYIIEQLHMRQISYVESEFIMRAVIYRRQFETPFPYLRQLKIAHVIGKAVWHQRGDIRDVISIGKLVRKNDGPEEVEQILRTMTKYSILYSSSKNKI